ncbi:MAG: histidine kinase [Clostridiaceae bacterium]|nr:histidine kinase [Clostridiaceae bacterium]
MMKSKLFDNIGISFKNLKLNRKIQLLLLLIIVTLFILFALQFYNMYRFNQQYDQIIANAAEAGKFSIDFKKNFDYKIYLLIAGHSSFEEEDPYVSVNEARVIAQDLIDNTSIEDNKRRAEIILKLLGNLEKYTKRIEDNKKVGGHYDDNINIWENDVQLVTGLIQSTVLEYTYYETSGMEQVRVRVSESLRRITLFSLILFAVLVTVALFLSVIIPNSIVRPIHHLNDVTKQVAEGDLSVRAKVVYGAEAKELGESLNIMIKQIDKLLTAVKIDEKNLRQAELELLQAQINPHFLYNTLDTIIWLAESGKQSEVVDLVESLSDFFRTSLSCGDGLVTLREEERHIRSYLQIQHVRYCDILEYEIDIPEILKETILPKITLQPIIENALYHGIKNRRGMGRIVIKAFEENGDVVVTVSDNGIGITDDRLDEIRAMLDKTNENGRLDNDSYGLFNVNERIKLKFGEKYGISITSTYHEGTCVRIRVPLTH